MRVCVVIDRCENAADSLLISALNNNLTLTALHSCTALVLEFPRNIFSFLSSYPKVCAYVRMCGCVCMCVYVFFLVRPLKPDTASRANFPPPSTSSLHCSPHETARKKK